MTDQHPADPRPADQFAASLSDLEARVAAADAGGEAVPAEARQMLLRLREITAAMHALTASLDPSADAPTSTPATATEPVPGA